MPRLSNSELNTSRSPEPSSYTINGIVLRNAFGEEVDIRQLVTDFTITESIYHQHLTLAMNIKDQVFLMEGMRFTGQERIVISLAHTGFQAGAVEKTVTHTFYVTEYPLYARQGRLQVYTIRGITRHAYLSATKQISRALGFTRPLTQEIKHILEKDLEVDPAKIDLSPTYSTYESDVRGVIPYMHPLDAINWILRRLYATEASSPFYCFETLGGKIRVMPQEMLLGAGSAALRTYRDFAYLPPVPYYGDEPRGIYEANRSKILALSSDLRMSKLAGLRNGAWGSHSFYVDPSDKTITHAVFKYEAPAGSAPLFRASTFLEGQGPAPEVEFSRFHVVPVNAKAYAGHTNYHGPTKEGVIGEWESAVESLDTIVHDITVYGDFELNAGVAVNLELQRAGDPEADVQWRGITQTMGKPQEPDQLLSGKYLVTSVVHIFENDYHCKMRVKKNTFPLSSYGQ